MGEEEEEGRVGREGGRERGREERRETEGERGRQTHTTLPRLVGNSQILLS